MCALCTHTFINHAKCILFHQTELDDKLDRLRSETEALLAYKVRVEKALEATAEPFSISQSCLVQREGRRGIDLNHDDVQKELMKEVEKGEISFSVWLLD